MGGHGKKADSGERRRIGGRIRRRRLFLNMTQGALARALGVTFQQIQKYENGADRVPERRLAALAHHLETTPDYFTGANADLAGKLEQFVQDPEGIALARAFVQIADAQTRARLVMAIGALSDSQARPEDSEAGLLSAWLRFAVHDGDTSRHYRNVAATVRALRSELAERVGKTLKARKLTQAFAAKILRTNQARISDLARGKVDAVSLEKLLRYLVLLGWDTRIVVGRRSAHAKGRIEITGD